MGKGDKKTAKGKRMMGSFGNTRKKKQSNSINTAKPAKKSEDKKVEPKKVAEKKAPAKKITPKKNKESEEK